MISITGRIDTADRKDRLHLAMLIHDVGSVYEVRRILHDLLEDTRRYHHHWAASQVPSLGGNGPVNEFFHQWQSTRYNQRDLARQLAQIDDMVRDGSDGGDSAATSPASSQRSGPRTAFT